MFRFNKFFFIVIDFFVSILIFIIIFKIRYSWILFSGVERRFISLSTLLFFSFYSLVLILAFFSFKLYEINYINKITDSIPAVIVSILTSVSFFGLFFYLTKINFARFVFFLGFLTIPFVIVFLNKGLFYLIRNKSVTKLLYFGSKKKFYLFEELILKYKSIFNIKYDFVFITESNEKIRKKVLEYNYIILDTTAKFKKWQIIFLHEYEVNGGKILRLLDLFENFEQRIPVEIIKSSYNDQFVFLKENFYVKYGKRIFDIFASLALLLVFLPLIIIISLLIKLLTKGSVIYKQKRITQNYKQFYIYKFRTMVTDCNNKTQSYFTKKEDSRVTLIGKIIRPFRLDELPQLINVLKGEMSLVGPRPERPEVSEKIIKKNPLFKKRVLVKPGLTGWAQVKYSYVNNFKEMDKKLSYDLYYIKNLSFKFDLIILLYTIETVIFRRNVF